MRGAVEEGTEEVRDWRAEAREARQEEESRLPLRFAEVVVEEPVSGREDLFS